MDYNNYIYTVSNTPDGTIRYKGKLLFIQKKIPKECNIPIVGEFNVNGKVPAKSTVVGKLHVSNVPNAQMEIEVCTRTKARPYGYVLTAEGNYIAVIKNKATAFLILIGIVLALAIGVAAFMCMQFPDKVKQVMPKIANGTQWDGNIDTGSKAVSEESIAIPGYSNIYVTKGQKVDLVNPKDNTVLFKYTITENDKTIYETDYILPGEKVEWDAYKDLQGAGKHNISFNISTVDSVDYTPCNGATMNVQATVG